MALRQAGRTAIANAIRTLDAFRHGNLSGGAPGSPYDTGRLPSGSGYGAAVARGHMLYVIRSYGTPIAWLEWRPGGRRIWVMPDARYSATTTNHQNVVRAELHYAGQDANTSYVVRDGTINDRDYSDAIAA